MPQSLRFSVVQFFTLLLFATLTTLAGVEPGVAKETKSDSAEGTTAEKKKEKPVVLKIGDKVPVFTGVDDRGKKWKSKEHVGKKFLIVYFYPADMTGGCTKQACTYRDTIKKLKRDDVEVIGISGDSVENHQHFRQEYKLNFTLLADPKGKIAKRFGVKTGKGGTVNVQLDGRPLELVRGVTARRWTFVIGKDGKILYKNEKVKPGKDAGEVLKVIEQAESKNKGD